MGFKEIVSEDNQDVFLNPDEFGAYHDICGRKLRIIIDDNEMVEREKRKRTGQEYRQGIYNKQVLFYVLGRDFGPLPAVGRSLKLDGRDFVITDAINEGGIYSISMEAVRA
ncbi:MAG: hypothetical protein SOX46_03295 [Clostridiaceae bacterium]|uniref:ATP-binding sugar transporter from pro-phage n=1 Tax=Clostridium porci TaxID=2605778 RepID=A0A7X2NKQ0_9CLOT|nr:hypothetical protein [Clostridium porci]MDY3230591.1 hypothetical protein [Clostridiaceae bacterium]MSS36612.1 hypothetical protein [Clostridium porci]